MIATIIISILIILDTPLYLIFRNKVSGMSFIQRIRPLSGYHMFYIYLKQLSND